jgi:TRAP-type C4-dicarboxylate transport system permease small subunit
MVSAIKKFLDRTLEMLAGVSMVVLVVDVVWQVITRFIMRNPSSWTEELATFLMIWVSLLGASVALNRGAHLGIDYFVQKLPPLGQLYVKLFIFGCVALFSLLVLTVGGINLVQLTLMREQLSPALGLPMGYVYLAVPVSGFFLVLYSSQFFIDTLVLIIKSKPAAGQSAAEQ